MAHYFSLVSLHLFFFRISVRVLLLSRSVHTSTVWESVTPAFPCSPIPHCIPFLLFPPSPFALPCLPSPALFYYLVFRVVRWVTYPAFRFDLQLHGALYHRLFFYLLFAWRLRLALLFRIRRNLVRVSLPSHCLSTQGTLCLFFFSLIRI